MCFLDILLKAVGWSQQHKPTTHQLEIHELGATPQPTAALEQITTHEPPIRRLIALEHSALGNLPFELIVYIADFLPLASAACFSLSCQRLSYILGTRYLRALQIQYLRSPQIWCEQSEYLEFLELLVREAPSHIACHTCTKLHALNAPFKHWYSSLSSLHWRLSHREGLHPERYIHRSFDFTVFQMAMKLYRLGLCYDELLGLLSDDSRIWSLEGFNLQCVFSSRIIAGSLFVRIQNIALIPLTRCTSFGDLYLSSLSICAHVNGLTLSRRHYTEHILHGWTERWLDPNVCYTRGRLHGCRYCLTEFQFDCQQFEDYGIVIYITKWQNLGQGQSPRDHEWQSINSRLSPLHWIPITHNRGTSRAAFQQGKKFRFDSLLTPQRRNRLIQNMEGNKNTSL